MPRFGKESPVYPLEEDKEFWKKELPDKNEEELKRRIQEIKEEEEKRKTEVVEVKEGERLLRGRPEPLPEGTRLGREFLIPDMLDEEAELWQIRLVDKKYGSGFEKNLEQNPERKLIWKEVVKSLLSEERISQKEVEEAVQQYGEYVEEISLQEYKQGKDKKAPVKISGIKGKFFVVLLTIFAATGCGMLGKETVSAKGFKEDQKIEVNKYALFGNEKMKKELLAINNSIPEGFKFEASEKLGFQDEMLLRTLAALSGRDGKNLDVQDIQEISRIISFLDDARKSLLDEVEQVKDEKGNVEIKPKKGVQSQIAIIVRIKSYVEAYRTKLEDEKRKKEEIEAERKEADRYINAPVNCRVTYRKSNKGPDIITLVVRKKGEDKGTTYTIRNQAGDAVPPKGELTLPTIPVDSGAAYEIEVFVGDDHLGNVYVEKGEAKKGINILSHSATPP